MTARRRYDRVMNRRRLLLLSTSLWLAVLAAGTVPAMAKDGESGGGDDHSGHGDGGGDDHGGSDNSGPGNADDRGDDAGADDNGGTGGQRDGGDGHGGDQREPIPLRKMLDIFAGYGDLTVVDVGLVRRNGDPQYKFRYIDGQGRVRNAYFDAVTGEQAR
jgi:hypothetical protein